MLPRKRLKLERLYQDYHLRWLLRGHLPRFPHFEIVAQLNFNFLLFYVGAMNNSTGIFTVKESGYYRLNFMGTFHPELTSFTRVDNSGSHGSVPPEGCRIISSNESCVLPKNLGKIRT